MRVRVTMDINKPLKRRMKLRKSGNEWIWVTFKYENVPTFCFICGLMGHADKFCSRIFDTPESELTRPYGAWMRAPFRRQMKMIGSKWLRNGEDDVAGTDSVGSSSVSGEKFTPTNKEMMMAGKIVGGIIAENVVFGDSSGNLKNQFVESGGNLFKKHQGVKILESKKRRTEVDSDNVMGLNTELCVDSEGEENTNMDHDTKDGPKNDYVAGAGERARLSQ